MFVGESQWMEPRRGWGSVGGETAAAIATTASSSLHSKLTLAVARVGNKFRLFQGPLLVGETEAPTTLHSATYTEEPGCE